ncbi:MAG: NusG domain II-containing protein [Sulfuricella sp.]
MILRLIKPGDWLVLLGGMLATGALFANLWQGNAADKAVVRSGGKVVAELSLAENRIYIAHGPLGASRIEIRNRRARVAADPSPRQYCVKQGWLAHAGDAALCLPNQVSLELTGAKKLYDSLNY